MSKLVWDIVGDYESCHMPHILIEERKHENAVESIFACLDCLEEGIRKAERERIIKLLSDTYGENCNRNLGTHDHEECWIYVEQPLFDLIALIKGENK